MQILKNSIVIRLFRLMYIYYNQSYAKQIVLRLIEVYRHSVLGKVFTSIANRESAITGSVFVKLIRIFFVGADRLVLWASKAISVGIVTSVIADFFKEVKKATSGKAAALALPLFGTGYALGRVIWNRLMIRDILFSGFMFIIGAILMVDSDKRKTVLKSSIVYKIYKLVLE